MKKIITDDQVFKNKDLVQFFKRKNLSARIATLIHHHNELQQKKPIQIKNLGRYFKGAFTEDTCHGLYDIKLAEFLTSYTDQSNMKGKTMAVIYFKYLDGESMVPVNEGGSGYHMNLDIKYGSQLYFDEKKQRLLYVGSTENVGYKKAAAQDIWIISLKNQK